MGTSELAFIENLVANEIRHLVAKEEGRIVSTSACVDSVLRVYPTCGLSRRAIEDMVIAQAARKYVVVEMDEAAPRRHAIDAAIVR